MVMMRTENLFRLFVFPLWLFSTVLMIVMVAVLIPAVAFVPENISGVRYANVYVVTAIMVVECFLFALFLHFVVVSHITKLSALLHEDPFTVAGDSSRLEVLRHAPFFGVKEIVRLQFSMVQMYSVLAHRCCREGIISSSCMRNGKENYHDEYMEPNLHSFSKYDYLLNRRYSEKEKTYFLTQPPSEVGLRTSYSPRNVGNGNNNNPVSLREMPTVESDFCTVSSSIGDGVGALVADQVLKGRHSGIQESTTEQVSMAADDNKSHEQDGCQQILPPLSIEDRAVCDPLDDNTNNSFDVLAKSLRLESSIIFQILRNLKVGRSLSSVTLPVHILESRSLLEMLSDMFVSWDLLLPLALGEAYNPVDRMRVMLRWFFSAYNWRPKGAAKKPYNPILGEIFQCKCIAPLRKYSPSSAVSPLASREFSSKSQEASPTLAQLSGSDVGCMHFLAEQVCHRPPVGVFYAELPKLIVAEGVFLPRSKIVSLNCAASISCSSVVVRFPKTGWSCRFSLPHAYASGVVAGTPRLELGGVIKLEDCHSSAHVTVDFRRKGFFGGKYDEVVAKISTEDGKGVAEEYTGLWHGTIFPGRTSPLAKTGKKRQHQQQEGNLMGDENCVEPLFDAETFQRQRGMRCCRPYAYPLPSDDNNDANAAGAYPKQSRAVWKSVTAAIRKGDEEAAANAKTAVEEAQRAERRQLEAGGRAHVPKCFQFIGKGELSYGHEDALANYENWCFTAREMLFK